MAVDSKAKSTEFTSAVTIVTAEWANSHYITEIEEGHTGHVHDGELTDGHAGKVNLTSGAHVRGQLRHANLADVAVQKRNVQTYPIGQISLAIPVYEVIDSVKQYYLDLSKFEPAGDDKNIQYNHNGLLGAESGFSWDYTNNRLGIGTDAPSARIHLHGTDNGPASWIWIDETEDGDGGGNIVFRKARGGADHNSGYSGYDPVHPDDNLGGISFYGFTSSDIHEGGGKLGAKVDGTPGVNEMPVRLEFSTRPVGATSFLSATDHLRMTIKNDGKVGIGIAEPTALLHVDGDTLIEGDLTVNGDYTTINTQTMTVDDPNIELNAIGSSATDTLADGGGITLHGSGSSVYTIAWANATNRWHFNQGIEIDGTDTNLIVGGDNSGTGSNQIGLRTDSPVFPFHMQNSSQLIAHNEPANPDCKSIEFHKSKGAVGAYADHTKVTTDDKLGAIRFFGADGAKYVEAAHIVSLVDEHAPGGSSAVNTDDLPGMLVLGTTSDGGSSVSERVRISSKGHVGIGLVEGGGTEVLRRLDVKGAQGDNSPPVRIREIPEGMGKVLVWDKEGSINLAGDVYWAPIEFFESTEENPPTVEVSGPENEDTAVCINPTSGGYDADGIELMFYSVQSNNRRPFHISKFGNLGVGKVNAGQTYRIDADGVVNATGFAIGGVALTASIGQLNDAGGQTPAAGGTAEANKAIVLDANKDIVGLRDQKLEGDIHFTNDTKGFKDANGNYQAKFNQVADAVNNLAISNAATGGAPVLAASGSDANVGLTFSTQGTGAHVLRHANQDTLAIRNDSGHAVYQQQVAGKDHVFQTQDGAEALRIKSNGNVGIGIASPDDYVDEKRNLVVGATTGHTGMTIVSGDVHIGTIQFRSDTAVNNKEGWIDYSQSLKTMRFGTNGLNTRMIIDSSGNIGIGTITPFAIGAGKVALTMADGATINWKHGANAASRVWGMRPDVEAWGDFGIITADAQDETLDTYRLYINPAGNIGIGTTNPATKLDVSGTVTTTALQAGNIKVNANIISSTNTNGDMALIPNGSGKVIIDGLNWPTADGGNGQVLTTDGGGNLSFTAASGGLSNVVEDTSPQLGANLDVQTFDITTSANNGNVHLKPNGAGKVSVGTGSGEAKVTSEGAYHLVLETNEGTNSGFIKIGSGSNGNIEIIPDGNGVVKLDNDSWPISSGTNGQVLKALGSGALGWGAGGLTDVVADTSPQLGGDLDVNGRKIVTTGGGDIALVTNAAGNVVLKNDQNDANRTELHIYDQDNAHFTSIRAAQDIASNFTLTLPSAVGTAGQALVTDNSGNLSWSAVGGTTTTINDNTNNYILTGSGSADVIGGEQKLTYDGTVLIAQDSDVLIQTNNTSDSAHKRITFAKSANATAGLHGLVANNEDLGALEWQASDGSDYGVSALIKAQIDAAPGDNDTPGRLTFWTTSNNADTATERMRIDSAGNIGINGCTDPKRALQTHNGDIAIRMNPGNSSVPKALIFQSGRDASVNGQTIVQQNDVLGYLRWDGADGDQDIIAASIHATVSGSPGNNNMPASICFSTNSGAAATTEKMILTPTGDLELLLGGEFRLYDDDSSNYVGFKSPATVGASKMWTLPTADGGAGDALTTDSNGTLSWAPSGGDAFKTIAVSGQSPVVADAAADTLTLVAGSNVTLTTDASNDSVTIAAAGGGLTDVVSDTTPQLGGSLDVNGNKIVSVSDADIRLAPHGSGEVRADAPLKIAYGDSHHTTISTTSGGETEITPSHGRLSVHGSLTAQRKVISVTNSNVALSGDDSGALVVFNSANGRVLTLPDCPSAQDEGMWFDIIIIDGPQEGHVHKIKVSDTANTRFKGSVIMFKPGTDNVSFLPGNSDIGLGFNGDTTGRINTTVRVICVAQDKWFIDPSSTLVIYSNNVATPFITS